MGAKRRCVVNNIVIRCWQLGRMQCNRQPKNWQLRSVHYKKRKREWPRTHKGKRREVGAG